ncbi:GNAT family N-acetyltransferase [Sphaerochaeta sp. PS]|uniref:GNAT family N-acetyltransferase n=1 Tax=Sphaerochaeta sp. PS TaxID=3076336 RepID=UPI0028A3DA7C|nr:GNAT family N-acetyltransferase [Sphaerochaeta sp. PS]MDT4761736.1 GNAT family N-acetyltransferase [Sphaerochaeta sp. PS]
MHKREQTYLLGECNELVIRSLEKADASQVVPYMGAMYANSPFLARYGDEWQMAIEDEAAFLEGAEKSENNLLLGGFLGQELVALCDFSPVGSSYKVAHRCQMGISVSHGQQGKGIGSLMLASLLDSAKQTGFSQMELEVVASNTRATKLYEKFGFRQVGAIPCGFRYREGYCEELLLLVKQL